MADKRISQLTPTTTVDLADQYAIARGSSNFHVSYNTLKTELSVNTSSFVKTVNAVAPDSVGNVTVSLTAVETGTSASMRAYSSSGLFTEGDVWVISGESGSASGSNGDSYIYSGENTLLRLSGPDTAANDARYVNVSGDTMTGDLILNGAPTTNNQAATKAYVDGLTTNGTNGQTIRFNGTTQTANSFLYNSGTQVAVGTTSPDAGRVFTVSDETSGNPQVQIHGGTTQATSPGLEFEGSGFGGVLWMDSTDGQFNFGARSGFPDRSRRVSAADPVDSHNLTTKNYVDTSTANPNYVAVAGDTMTGLLVLSANPTASLGAATKQYADNVVYTAPVMFSGTGTGTSGDYTAGTKLQFNVDVDTNSGWSTDTYTIPEDGVYEIITSLRTRIETDDRRSAIFKGTGHIRIIENPQGATGGIYRSRTGVGHIITSLVTGDTISVGAFQTTTNYPNVSENGLSIRKLRN
jgi:hypothetical protein